MLVLPKPKLVARLLASDFPSKNPRTQTRNFPYTTTLCFIKKLLKLKKKFEIKPLTRDERQRIQSGKESAELSIFFFALLSTVLISVFTYGIFKSSNDILMIIFLILLIIGIIVCLFYWVKSDMSEIRNDNLKLKKNEKYCSKGYLNGKFSKHRQLGLKSSITQFYATIDNKEYEISRKNYENINSGDYVYFEIKEPLYTEVKKIDELY